MVHTSQDNGCLPTEPASEPTVRPVSADTLASLTAVAEEVGGPYKPRPGTEGAVAYTERLRKSISGIDRGQWGMLPGLAPGQALVSLTHMTRPLLVSVDPAPCQLRLSE